MPSYFFFPEGYYDQFLGFLDFQTYTEDHTILISLPTKYKIFYTSTHDKLPYDTYVEVNIIDQSVENSDEYEPTLYYVPDEHEPTPTAYYKVSSPLVVEYAIKPFEFTPRYEPLEKDSDGQINDNGQISTELLVWLNQITQYTDAYDPDLEDAEYQTVGLYLWNWLSNPTDPSTGEWVHEDWDQPPDSLYIKPEDSYFMYRIVQWGDEKNLLSDDDIRASQYFAPYQTELPDSINNNNYIEPMERISNDDDNIFRIKAWPSYDYINKFNPILTTIGGMGQLQGQLNFYFELYLAL